MERDNYEVLEDLKSKGVPLYSISRLDCINRCLYEAYRTYELHERGSQNVYACLGGKTHEVLEKIVNDEADESDLKPAILSELDDMDMLGIEFPKDRNGGDSIKDGWVKNMMHFADTYKSPRGDNYKTEEMFLYKTPGGHYLHGYIDLQRVNNDGTISIFDYKTSSMYKGEDLKEHGRQLVVYAKGLEQNGFKVRDVAWIFLKYVDITFMGYKTAKSKNKSEIKKTIERKKIGIEMAKYVERDLIELGIDEVEIDIILDEFKETNMFPKQVTDRYDMKVCVLDYELTDEVKSEVDEYIDTTADMWEAMSKNEKDYTPRSFTKVQKSGKEVDDYFFCTSLCGHFKNCPHIQEFLDKKNTSEDDEYADLF